MKKISKEAIRGAMQVEYSLGTKISEIAKKFEVTEQTVRKWIKRDNIFDKKRVRQSKLKKQHKDYIFKLASGKFSGKDNASVRKITKKLCHKFKINISTFTVHKFLKEKLSKPIKAQKTFFLNPRDFETRKRFAKYVIDNNIKGEDVFFTDEKIFSLDGPLNPATNKIRLCKKDREKLRNGNEEICNKVYRPAKKFPERVMVSGGLCKDGVSKLIFCVGTMEKFAYKKCVDYFKEDYDRMGGDYYFMQDGARCHLPAKPKIIDNFNRYFALWPPNSPGKNKIFKIYV
jgi:transposase